MILAGFRNRKRRARAGTPNQNRFSSILGSAPRRSGGFSLQRELCFHFGGQWQLMSIFCSILESFWEPKPQLSLLWCLPESILGSKMRCRFKGDFLRISRGRQDSEDVLGGRRFGCFGAPEPSSTDCRRHTPDSKMQTARRRHTETQRRRMKPNASQPGGPHKGGRRICIY